MSRQTLEQLDRTALAGVYNVAPTTIPINAVSNRNPVGLSIGEWEIESTSDCHYLQGGSTVVATTLDVPLTAGRTKRIEVTGPNTGFVAVVEAAPPMPGNLFVTNPRGPAT